MIFIILVGLHAIAPPAGVHAYDTPDDGGGSITVEWQLSSDDAMIEGYEIHRSEEGSEYIQVGYVGRGRSRYDDETADNTEYYYKVASILNSDRSFSDSSPPAFSRPQLFDRGATNLLIGTIISCAIILYFIQQARKGKKLHIRKISGLDAVDEAVGRATEMGRPVLYSMGIGLVDYIATIASFNILGEIAKKTGHYETPLIVPTSDPVVYTVAREIVKESYASIGRPDLFDTDRVYFVTDSQFAYAAAVDGVMLREKPAANFFIGYFKAESLVMAETGASTGAIQIAGTDQITQLPFFVTACDFTLIGEELYAASAYISKEPLLLGAIKGEDLGKIIILIVLVAASAIGLLTNFPVLNVFR